VSLGFSESLMNTHSYTQYNHHNLSVSLDFCLSFDACTSAAISRLLPSEVNARLLSLAVNVGLLSLAANARLLPSEVNARLTWLICYLLIYLRPLLLNGPFFVTVETSVRVTVELLLLPK
jgi:hypothetical protein